MSTAYAILLLAVALNLGLSWRSARVAQRNRDLAFQNLRHAEANLQLAMKLQKHVRQAERAYRAQYDLTLQ